MLGKGINNGFIRNNYKDLNFQDNYLIKQKEIIENQPLTKNINNKSYTDADSLVEYFHGMLLNYINIKKSKGKLSDQSIKLINIINDYNKQKLSNKIKINGGYFDNYQDDKNIDVTGQYKFYNNIKVDYIYQYDKNCLVHNINIYSNIDETNVSLSDFSDIMEIENTEEDENTDDMEIENTEEDENTEEIEDTEDMEIENENNNKAFNLVIDFVNGMIYETNQKIKTRNVYNSSTNIDYLLEKIIEKMIYILYNKEYKWSSSEKYNKEEFNVEDNESLYQSVLSLLIILLSFRKNMSKKIYAKYNYERFLMDIDKNIREKSYLFNNNDNIILTYAIINDEQETKCQFSFDGDCALNTLMCVKKEDLQKMLIIKKEIIENGDYLGDEGDKGDKRIDYIKIIQKIIDKFDCRIKNNIKKYITYYATFIDNFINYQDWLKYKDINNIDINKLINNLKLFNDYKFAINSILMDYNLDEYLIKNITDVNKEKNNEKINQIIENNYVYYNNNLTKTDLIEIKKIYEEYHDIITNNNINTDLFYVNMIISLLLIYYKVDYLFDEKILEIFKDDDIKKYAIRRFSNIATHQNELDRIRFNCKTHNNHDYLFKYATLPEHAVLLIIDVDTNDLKNKKYSICDLNDLNFAVLGDTLNTGETKKEKEKKEIYYNFGKTRFTYGYYYYLAIIYHAHKLKGTLMTYEELYDMYDKERNKENEIEEAQKISVTHDHYYCHLEDNENINSSIEPFGYSLIGICKSDKFIDFINTTDKNNYIFYRDTHKEIYYHFKKSFFDGLKEKYNNNPREEKLVDNIEKYIIDEKKCTTDNFLYYLIKELHDFIYSDFIDRINIIFNRGQITQIEKSEEINEIENQINILEKISEIDIAKFYNDIIKDYDDIDTNKVKIYLALLNNEENDEIYNYITQTLIKYSYGIKYYNKLFNGGELLKINNLSHNNSIIKKILIILLVIVIIIIVVLIVLYIINKYKNKNNFK